MKKNKMINFGAGPAALPQSVLEQAAAAVLNLDGSGLSVLEIAHRGPAFDAILSEARSLVMELTGLDDQYEVLWLQGGGRMQFTMLPMNFLNEGETAGYIDSGHWAHDAMSHGKYYGDTVALSSTRDINYVRLPEWPAVLPGHMAYVHMTTNNTIYGTQWDVIPECSAPLIADMSSDIFSRQRDYSRFAMIYAVAQKNVGAAGVTMVVLRKDLLAKIKRNLPPMLDYAKHARQHSVLNTPPVFAIYTCLLTLRWIKAQGMEKLEQQNNDKAALLYSVLDNSSIFQPVVQDPDSRSKMNVVFRGRDAATEQAFLAYAAAQHITGIAGHRSVGGFRVSLYNAISMADVEQLTDVMQQFEQEQKKNTI
jgi:phosphoserine aminotransferase